MSLFENEEEKRLFLSDDSCTTDLSKVKYLIEFQKRGWIKKGDIIIAPRTNATINVDNYNINTKEPGFLKIMKEMFGDDWHCNDGVGCGMKDFYFKNLKELAFLYEINSYANNEKKIGNDLMGEEYGEWIAARSDVKNLDNYRSFINEINSVADNKRFTIFANCSIKNHNAEKMEEGDEGIIFLGMFAFDKVATLYHKRIILHLVSDEYRFPQA